MSEKPSHHDLHVTTETIPRTSIFDLPFGLRVTCSRPSGWELWDASNGGKWTVIAAEYKGDGSGLRLDVAGAIIVNSLSEE
jgi:hypothetical protein